MCVTCSCLAQAIAQSILWQVGVVFPMHFATAVLRHSETRPGDRGGSGNFSLQKSLENCSVPTDMHVSRGCEWPDSTGTRNSSPCSNSLFFLPPFAVVVIGRICCSTFRPTKRTVRVHYGFMLSESKPWLFPIRPRGYPCKVNFRPGITVRLSECQDLNEGSELLDVVQVPVYSDSYVI